MKILYKNLPDGTKKFVGFYGDNGKIFDEILEAGNDDDIESIEANNCVFEDGKVIVTEQNKKKKEARQLIEKYLKQHDQLNTLFEFMQEFHDVILTEDQKGSLTKNSKMKDSWRYINEILNEYRTNGEDANYSEIEQPTL